MTGPGGAPGTPGTPSPEDRGPSPPALADGSVVLALLLLAALAWGLPRLPSRPVRTHAYAARPEAGAPARLLWSPRPRPPAAPPGGWRGLLLGEPLDVNRATAEDLEALPGVGPVTAAAILAERKRLGGYRSLEELRAAAGVGRATLERLRPYLGVGSP